MACRNCDSERIAFLQAHSKDLSILEVEHLSLELDGYFPEIPGVCSGDDADFYFCLECGMIQSDTFPITDETIKEAFAPDEGFDDSLIEYEDDNESKLTTYRLDNGSMDECVTKHGGEFLQLSWVNTIKEKEGFYSWALTMEPDIGRVLIAVFYLEEDIVLNRVALVPPNTFNYDMIQWKVASKHLNT